MNNTATFFFGVLCFAIIVPACGSPKRPSNDSWNRDTRVEPVLDVLRDVVERMDRDDFDGIYNADFHSSVKRILPKDMLIGPLRGFAGQHLLEFCREVGRLAADAGFQRGTLRFYEPVRLRRNRIEGEVRVEIAERAEARRQGNNEDADPSHRLYGVSLAPDIDGKLKVLQFD